MHGARRNSPSTGSAVEVRVFAGERIRSVREMLIPNVATVDALEPRLLLSQTASPLLLTTTSADGVIVAAKKSGEGSVSKGKGHGKSKKSPEIMVLVNGSSIANGVASVDFGTVTVGDAAP